MGITVEQIPCGFLDKVPIVYFISDPSGFIKIGVTEHLWKRIRYLQTSTACDLNLIATIQCKNITEARYYEKDLHELFDSERVRGEWFRYHEGSKIFNWLTRKEE